jgi:hypothetical protein
VEEDVRRIEAMASYYLPKRVCVVDLETSKLIRRSETPPLAFVGTMIYDLRCGSYHPGPHRCFFPDDLGELEQLLKDFEGIVLGHNILRFDYDAVLRSHISLDRAVEKTVDTLAFLYEKRSTEPPFSGGTSSSLEGLSLDYLAQKNLGRSKAISGRSIPKLWREGHREEVIAYNKEDLALTFSLWWWMVEGRTVFIREQEKHDPQIIDGDRIYRPGEVEIFKEDRPRLTGEKPLFNTRIVQIFGGPALEEPPPEASMERSHWYLHACARHYLYEDVLMISDPRMNDLSCEYFEAGPYPASWFTFRVEREGPDFPARDSGETIDISEL